MKKKFWGRKD